MLSWSRFRPARWPAVESYETATAQGAGEEAAGEPGAAASLTARCFDTLSGAYGK